MSSPPILPDGTHPGPVRLRVAELERSVDWYARTLGMRVLSQDAGEVVLGTGAGGGPGLVTLVEHTGASPVAAGGRPGLYHYALLLPDRASLGRFVGHLQSLGVAAGATDHRVSEALYLGDPDGHGIEVYADRPRSGWTRTVEGEVAMSTDPLDPVDLLRAGGDAAWEGLPPGTVMGHLHLHVGDLEQAESFYGAGVGLEVTVRGYPGALFLSAGGYHHHLGLNTWARRRDPAPPDEARLLLWELVVPSSAHVDAALERLAGAGHPVEPTDRGGVIRDPWGTRLHLRIA
jgi:catechol 2,3-dioxygenase